jgi:ParB-like chromosome segregation protein Spo0J
MTGGERRWRSSPTATARPTVSLPLDSVVLGSTPRQDGVDRAHVRALAAADGPLPPITVHSATLRVIDGVHRVHAARLRGETTVRAQLFEVDEAAAYALAVRLNIAHSRPLSRADRLAAAQRLTAFYPRWSDRRIAATVGVGAAAVAGLRERSTAPDRQLNVREGRDGRLRPLDASEGRLRAARLLAADPATPLRRVAAEAGIALGTAKDVRDRLRAGRSPVPDGRDVAQHRPKVRTATDSGPETHPVALSSGISGEPALRYTESGRRLLDLLGRQPLDIATWRSLADSVPEHRRPELARLARQCVARWAQFAQLLEEEAPQRDGR